MLKYWLSVLTLLSLVAAAGAAPGSVGWRTDGTGAYPDATPPLTWSADSNVVWKTKLPGKSNASPILVGNRLFVCSEPTTLVCLSAADGTILWERSNDYLDILPADQIAAAEAAIRKGKEIQAEIKPLEGELRKLSRALKETPDSQELKTKTEELKPKIQVLKDAMRPLQEHLHPAAHGVNGYSSATPTSDGKHVYVLFGTGVAACYDLQGTRRWARLIERPTQGWGHSASPLLVGGKLIVHVRNLTALNPDTGELLWQAASAQAWGSPVRATVGEQTVIVTASGDVVLAADGRVLAKRVSPLTYCAPLVSGSTVFFIQHKGQAVALPDRIDDTFTIEKLWQTSPPNERYYASPILHDGIVYAIMQKHILSAIDALTGEVIYSEKLPMKGTVYPSVTLAGDRLYVSSDDGTTVVVTPGREYRAQAVNKLEPFRSSPVFQGTRLYIRTLSSLYCIGD